MAIALSWFVDTVGDEIAGSASRNVVGAIKMETSTSDVNGPRLDFTRRVRVVWHRFRMLAR